MCFIVQLHYALRAALLQLDRLEGFRLVVRAECSSIFCAHVVELRVILTSRSQPDTNKDHRGEDSVVIHIRPPRLVTAIMKTATVARCSIANELLRRRKHTERVEGTRRPRLAVEVHCEVAHQSADAGAAHGQGCSKRAGPEIRPSTDFSTAHEKSGVATAVSPDPLDHPQPSPATKSQVTTHCDSSSDITTVADCGNSADAARGKNPHRQQQTMWRTGLLYLDRGDSAIIAALKDAGFNTQQTPGSPNRRFSQSSDANHSREHSRDGRFRPDPIPAQQWVMPADSPSLKFSPPPTRQKQQTDATDNFSPTSDTTLFEEPPSYSLDRIVEDEGKNDYFSYEGKDGKLEKEKDAAKNDTDETTANIQRRRASIRHQRAPSTPSTPSSPVARSTFGSAKRLSRELPARAKTSEGLLQLQANPAKPQRPAQGHQRRISLGLPIKTPTAQADVSPPSASPTPRSAPTTRPNRAPELPSPTHLNQEERDLEYKHRHTFIGTASLDDFLEVLEVSSSHTASKTAVAKAFIVLAASERLLARQASSTPAGWELVPRVTPDVPNYDYVAQAHVRLGSITLWQFLELMPFDGEEEAGAMSVVEAFSAASHMDAKASTGIASKARAFRSWMVKQAATLSS